MSTHALNAHERIMPHTQRFFMWHAWLEIYRQTCRDGTSNDWDGMIFERGISNIAHKMFDRSQPETSAVNVYINHQSILYFESFYKDHIVSAFKSPSEKQLLRSLLPSIQEERRCFPILSKTKHVQPFQPDSALMDLLKPFLGNNPPIHTAIWKITSPVWPGVGIAQRMYRCTIQETSRKWRSCDSRCWIGKGVGEEGSTIAIFNYFLAAENPNLELAVVKKMTVGRLRTLPFIEATQQGETAIVDVSDLQSKLAWGDHCGGGRQFLFETTSRGEL